MGHAIMINALSWIAIVVLASGYWIQVWKIHLHKEVRDLSIGMYLSLAAGFCILLVTAYTESSVIFFFKQAFCLVPVFIILLQIRHHNKDHWHDDDDFFCLDCGEEMEIDWNHCPYCGSGNKEKL